MSDEKDQPTNEQPERSFLGIIVHSFFIIPFLIVVFCLLLFGGMYLLTKEKQSVYDYLEDVKTGGAAKRWQGAFELSKMLANPDIFPHDSRFIAELSSAFEAARHDDNRVRQYLALAMGRTQLKEFAGAIVEGLKGEKEENIPALLYALGMLKDPQTSKDVEKFADHPNARVRSIAIVSLGSIGNPQAKQILKDRLSDTEANVQWGAALSLGKMSDYSGRGIIGNLMDRSYLGKFAQVDDDEKDHLIMAAAEVAVRSKDHELINQVINLSKNDPNMQVRAFAHQILDQAAQTTNN